MFLFRYIGIPLVSPPFPLSTSFPLFPPGWPCLKSNSYHSCLEVLNWFQNLRTLIKVQSILTIEVHAQIGTWRT